MREFLKKLIREEKGQDFVEYALLIGGIAMVLTASVGGLGAAIQTAYGQMATFVGTI